MNKNKGKLRGNQETIKETVIQRGSIIANKDQIEFLISLLQKHSAEYFYNRYRKYTKDSPQPLANLYSDKIVSPSKLFSLKEKVFLSDINAETIYNLIQKGEATKTNTILNELGGLALYLENKATDLLKCCKLIQSKLSWQQFLKQFNNEIGLTETYILYYWKHDYINIAKVFLKLNANKTNWEDCRIYYYDYNDKTSIYEPNDIQTDVQVVEQFAKKNLAFSFYVSHDWQIAQYNIITPSDIQHQQFFICSYSSYSKPSIAFGGVGILFRENNVEEKILSINRNKKVDDGILNLLHEKKVELEYLTTNFKILPNHTEIERIKKIQGVWKMFMLRNSKPEEANLIEEKGGIETNYLFIDSSGLIRLKGKENDFNGFLTFPMSENKKLIKCNIQESSTKGVFKVHMLLNLKQNNKILEGVITGWSNRGKSFSSLIRLIRESNNVGFKEASNKKYIPGFIKKTEIESSPELTSSLISFLKNDKKYLDLAGDCLPVYEIENKKIFTNIAGCYYLLSRDFEEGLIDKAKLEILSDGTFKANYPDVSYKGTVKEFVTIGNDQHIYLDVLQKKLSIQRNWTNFSGAFLFNMENILITDKDALSKKIDLIVGFSLRKNASKLSQVKKEFLIPAEDVQKFYIEEPDKYSYSFEKKLLYNLKANSNHHNLSVNYHKLIRAIRGKENNIMLLSNQHSITNIQRETDYFEIYMSAFLFEIIFVPNLNFNKIYDYLLQSLLHLNDSKQLFNKLDSVFLKYQVEEKIKNEIIRNINILFKATIVESNNGNLSSLLEKIKSLNLESSRIPLVKKINHIIQKMRLLLNK